MYIAINEEIWCTSMHVGRCSSNKLQSLQLNKKWGNVDSLTYDLYENNSLFLMKKMFHVENVTDYKMKRIMFGKFSMLHVNIAFS